MSKIFITGWPGTGKSTYAKKLAKEKGLRHLCTDPQRMCDEGVTGTPDDLDWSSTSKWVAKEAWENVNKAVKEAQDLVIEAQDLALKCAKIFSGHRQSVVGLALFGIIRSLEKVHPTLIKDAETIFNMTDPK